MLRKSTPWAATSGRGGHPVVTGLAGACDLQRAGVAAPQIGISRAAAIVIPPDPGAEPLIMLNPQVISESAEADEQYEGCLSFFDVRGLVPRAAHRGRLRRR